jgi:hypothetical protein
VVFDPTNFIPNPTTVRAATGHPEPYALAWRESHSSKSLSEAIDSVSGTLGVCYDLASALVWAEMSSQTPVCPG